VEVFCDAIKNPLEVLVNVQNIIKLLYFGLQFHLESKVWRVGSVGEVAILFLVITCLSHTSTVSSMPLENSYKHMMPSTITVQEKYQHTHTHTACSNLPGCFPQMFGRFSVSKITSVFVTLVRAVHDV
jgi:hypothetical protein